MTNNTKITHRPQPILDIALELHAEGFQVLPVKKDGSKRPNVGADWPNYQATSEEIEKWYGNKRPRTGLGIITGEPSGNVELLEIEGDHAEKITTVEELAEDRGASDLLERVRQGYCERSPSGGLHILYRLDLGGEEMPGNKVLARTADKEVIAETRGRGGFCVVAPSGGPTHSTGEPYVRLHGGPTELVTITMEEREALLALFRELDETPAAASPPVAHGHRTGAHEGELRPGDDFNARADWLEDVLAPAGWEIVKSQGEELYLRRPGAQSSDRAKHDATLNYGDADKLYVFSTSTDFEPEMPYSKFSAYATLNHTVEGEVDWAAAAKALRKRGYGRKAQSKKSADCGGLEGALALTDRGNALLLAERHRDRLLYYVEAGKWMYFTGTHWVIQDKTGGMAMELMAEAILAMTDSEQGYAEEDLPGWQKKSLSASSLEAALKVARTLPGLRTSGEQLDQHAYELNTPGGIVDLRTGKLLPHDPEKLHTTIAGTTPDHAAERSLWQEFLDTSVPDQELQRYLKRLIGMAAIGEVQTEILVFFWGRGGSGKTVFIETVKAALGAYAVKAPANYLMDKTHDDHPTEIMALKGARFAVASEVKASARLNEQRVKELTGNEELTGRYMRQDYQTFLPTHTLCMVGNDRPAFDGTDIGMTRRMRILPFDEEIPDDKKVPQLKSTLIREHLPAVLTWIIEGTLEYLEHGLGETPEVVESTNKEYAAENDTVGRFLDELYIVGTAALGFTQSPRKTRRHYEAWCKGLGIHPVGPRRFAQDLRRHGVQVGDEGPRTGGGRYYGNIRPRGDDE